MATETTDVGGVVRDLSENLGGFFRHVFPGAIVLGAAFLANPKWFAGIDPGSPWHLLLISVVATVIGNTWFVFNRYGVHQLVDWFLYCLRSKGPERPAAPSTESYIDVLAEYVFRSSLIGPELAGLRRHVGFRASAVLLIYTVGEVAILFAFLNEPGTFFARYQGRVSVLGMTAMALGLWQNVITRRIDWYSVTHSR